MTDEEIKEWATKIKTIIEVNEMSMRDCYLAFALELRKMRKYLQERDSV